MEHEESFDEDEIMILDKLLMNFFRKLDKINGQFTQNTQEDAHEFLMFLMNQFHDEVNRVKNQKYIQDKDYISKFQQELTKNILNEYENHAKDSWETFLHLNKSIIVDLFAGQLKSMLRCMVCDTISNKFDTFFQLSIPVVEKNLNDNIKLFTQTEELQSSEFWYCPKCQQKQQSTKKIDIWKAPNVLIIQLKRFEYQKEKLQKIKQIVDFPIEHLDLTEITLGPQKSDPIYQLVSICVNFLNSVIKAAQIMATTMLTVKTDSTNNGINSMIRKWIQLKIYHRFKIKMPIYYSTRKFLLVHLKDKPYQIKTIGPI